MINPFFKNTGPHDINFLLKHINLKNDNLPNHKITDIKDLNTSEKNEITLIDVRDIRELWRDGTIENAKHIPRGMLEFWLDPNSSYYQENKIKDTKKMVFFCAMGFRSALATKALVDMGFKNVANAKGGFDALKNAGLKVVQKDKK